MWWSQLLNTVVREGGNSRYVDKVVCRLFVFYLFVSCSGQFSVVVLCHSSIGTRGKGGGGMFWGRRLFMLNLNHLLVAAFGFGFWPRRYPCINSNEWMNEGTDGHVSSWTTETGHKSVQSGWMTLEWQESAATIVRVVSWRGGTQTVHKHPV